MLHTYNIYVFVKKYYNYVCVYVPTLMSWLHCPTLLLDIFCWGRGWHWEALDSQDVCISSKWRGPKTHPNISKKNDMFFLFSRNWPRLRSFSWLQQSKNTCWITLILSMWLSWVWDTARYTFFQILLDFLPMRKWSSFDEHICSDGLVQPPTSYDFWGEGFILKLSDPMTPWPVKLNRWYGWHDVNDF